MIKARKVMTISPFILSYAAKKKILSQIGCNNKPKTKINRISKR